MKTLFSLLAVLTTLSCSAQRYITIYRQELDAYVILGTGKEWGPAGATLKTVLITTPVVTTDLNQLLGSYYSVTNFADATDFLNILTGEREPILDSINFKFYRTSAFLNTLNRNTVFRNDPQYRIFKTAFLNARTDAARRVILFDDANTSYREALENARYTVYQNPISITAFTTLARTFKVGLGADAAATIRQVKGVNFNASLEASINDIVNRSVTMTGAKYHEIKLQPAYVAIASSILRYYDGHRDQIRGDSEFLVNLRQFLESENYAITVGAASIESTFTTTSMKNLKIAIGAAVKANLASSNVADTTKNRIAANAEAKFSRESLKQIGVSTDGQSFYNIRLVYSPKLEIGAGVQQPIAGKRR